MRMTDALIAAVYDDTTMSIPVLKYLISPEVALKLKHVIGDNSRCGLVEAMVRSLAFENRGNMDFGVGTVASTSPSTDAEWEQLFNFETI